MTPNSINNEQPETMNESKEGQEDLNSAGYEEGLAMKRKINSFKLFTTSALAFLFLIIIFLLFAYLRPSDSPEKQTDSNSGNDWKQVWMVEDQKVYYASENFLCNFQMMGSGKKCETKKLLLENADALSFVPLNNLFAKDNKSIFCKNYKINEADISPFTIMDEYGLAFDDQRMYYCSNFASYHSFESDPQSLVKLPRNYIKFDKAVINNGDIVEGADPETLVVYDHIKTSLDAKSYDSRVAEGNYDAEDMNFLYFNGDRVGIKEGAIVKLNDYYSKDDSKIYFDTEEINADWETFEVIEGKYARDKNYIYMEGKKNNTADVGSFEVLSEAYAKDKNSVYREYKTIPGADPETFIFYSDPEYPEFNRFAKDKNRIYCDGADNFYEGVDPATFEHLAYIYSKDKNRVYYNCKGIIEGADAPSFKALSGEYAIDKNRAYDGNIIIAGADPDTFEIVDQEFDITKDQNQIYVSIKAYPEVDIKTFKYLGHGYYVDKNAAYEVLSKINEADVATFEVLDYRYTKDKEHIFCRQTGVCDRILEDADPDSFRLLNEEELKQTNWKADAKDKNNYYKIGRSVML